MKTAVQTLISQIETEINKVGNGTMATGFNYGLKKAKQLAEELLKMEKKQIVDAFNEGNESDWTTEVGNGGEQYYDFIFKQKENEELN